jgi:DnaJ-class molecular chaperone
LRRAADQFLGEDKAQQKPSAYLNAQALKALETLEASPPYTQKSIKKAYKTLIKKHHPDSNNGSKEAEEKIICINEAYKILKNNPHILD